MASSSSNRWKKRQAADPYVQKAQQEGWRSRAVYKLQELDKKQRVLRKGGGLGGYHWGITRKQAIIGWEAAHTA